MSDSLLMKIDFAGCIHFFGLEAELWSERKIGKKKCVCQQHSTRRMWPQHKLRGVRTGNMAHSSKVFFCFGATSDQRDQSVTQNKTRLNLWQTSEIARPSRAREARREGTGRGNVAKHFIYLQGAPKRKDFPSIAPSRHTRIRPFIHIHSFTWKTLYRNFFN